MAAGRDALLNFFAQQLKAAGMMGGDVKPTGEGMVTAADMAPRPRSVEMIVCSLPTNLLRQHAKGVEGLNTSTYLRGVCPQNQEAHRKHETYAESARSQSATV